MTTVQGITKAVYPIKPEPHLLRTSYERLRKAAIGISISRGIYYGKLKKAKSELTTLKAAIEIVPARRADLQAEDRHAAASNG